MAHQYITPENLVETFRQSKKYTEGLTDNFPEYERLARNKPHASIPKEYPKTTDGTLASIIRKTPHRIIQQLPTGKVKSVTDDWLSVVASFIYREQIIPNANEGYALLQKCWNVVERFLTYGSCPTYVPFTEHNGYFCTDLRLPYWADIFLQPGKISDEDSNYVFMRSYWQPGDIDALIKSQEKLGKGVERTWDVDALKKVKEIITPKDEKARTPSDKESKAEAETAVELITAFQRGKNAKFYTFHMQNTGTGAEPVYEGTIVRTKTNKDPRGELPIAFAYGDIDGSNPFGRSIIELAGALQNLMDGEMQMYQYNRALQLNPPLIKRGNFSKNKIKFVPNIIIDVGSDPNATVEPLTIDTTALANFPNNYGLMKSQMLNLLASPDTSISAEVGNPGFSKTPQGVEASRANLSIDDNYVRKQFETWFERWSETAINLYFAERTGVEELQLDKDTIDELMELAKEGKFNPALINEEGKIRIDYNQATEKLKFEVDASTSKMQDEIKELQSLTGVVELLDKSQFLQGIVPPQKHMALWNAIVRNAGIEDPEDLILQDQEIQEAIQRMQENKQDDIKDMITTNYKDAPEDIKRQIEAKNGFQPSQMTSPVQQAADAKNAPQGQPESPVNADHLLKADQQEHDKQMDVEKLKLEYAKLNQQSEQAKLQTILQAKAQERNQEQQTANQQADRKNKEK